jgi:tetratricopeptide (TPR) repeat protein
MAHKEEESNSDEENYSESDEIPPSTTNNPLIELYDLRQKIAPLLGRLNSSTIAQLSTALDKFPDQAQWYVSRGMVHAKLEKFDEAIQDLTTGIELATDAADTVATAAETSNETVCSALLNRAKSRSELGDLEGAVIDAKLALDHASSISHLEAECRNVGALYRQKLKVRKEMASAAPEIVHHGSGIVIEDVTEEHAKVSAKKARIIAAVGIAKGGQQADVGRAFRAQFNEKVKAFEQEEVAKERGKKAKKKKKKKKKAAAAAAVAGEPVSSSSENYKKLYKVETLPDPDDAEITIERIHIPIIYESKLVEGAKNVEEGIDEFTTAPVSTEVGTIPEQLIPGMSIGSVDVSKFDFLKRYNI